MSRLVLYLNVGIPVMLELLVMLIGTGVSKGTYSLLLVWEAWVVLPGVLAAINLALFALRIEQSFLRCSAFMLLGLLIAVVVGYLNWGLSTKRLLNPDGLTVSVVTELVVYYMCVVGMLFLVVKGGQMLFGALLKK